MNWLIVTTKFVDKNSKELREVFDILYCNEERAKELIEKGFVIDRTEEINKALAAKDDTTKELTLKEVKNRLLELGVDFDSKAKKSELLQLLEHAQLVEPALPEETNQGEQKPKE